MIGMFASSKSGHDKDNLYIIIKEDGEYVYLADGKTKTLEHPKKKNRKHIQIIKKEQDMALTEALQTGERIQNEQIKRAIRLYAKSMTE